MTYPGGKNASGTYQKIINLIPPHQVYIEPFLGSGAILRLKKPAPMANIGMDADSKVIEAFEESISLPFKEVKGVGIPHLSLFIGDAIEYLRALETNYDAFPRYYGRKKGETFIYLDPPYLHDTRSHLWLYRYEMSKADHIKLLEVILRLPCMVAISGYESALYNDYLAAWRKTSFNAITRGGTCKTETVWMNYPEPLQLHDYRFLGNDYRERERIKRKKDRWTSRLASMPTLERYAILAAIQQLNSPSPFQGEGRDEDAPSSSPIFDVQNGGGQVGALDPTAIYDAPAVTSNISICDRSLK